MMILNMQMWILVKCSNMIRPHQDMHSQMSKMRYLIYGGFRFEVSKYFSLRL